MAQPMHGAQPEKQMLEVRKRVEEQRAELQRPIVSGAATQGAEDLLHDLLEGLRRLAQQAGSCG